MKKIQIVLSALAVLSAIFTFPVLAEPTDKQAKQAQSEAKKMARQLEKQGWEIVGPTTLATALEQYYLLLTPFGGHYSAAPASEILQFDIKNGINNAYRRALLDAQSNYIQEAESYIEGILTEKVETNEFRGMFKQSMMKTLHNEVIEVIRLCKTNSTDPSLKDIRVLTVYDRQLMENKGKTSIIDILKSPDTSDEVKATLMKGLSDELKALYNESMK